MAFVGFILERRGDAVRVTLKTENVRRFRRRMGELRRLHAAGAIEIDEVTSRVRAWLAHARHGDTRALCERVLGELSFSRASPDVTSQRRRDDSAAWAGENRRRCERSKTRVTRARA